MSWAVRILTPILSVLGLWYLAIFFSGLPAFVIPRPERVLDVLWVRSRLYPRTSLGDPAGRGDRLRLGQYRGASVSPSCSTCCRSRATCLLPAAITLRNVPYIAMISVLMLAFGDSMLSKTTIVALAGFFPVLVNTMQGLRAADEVQLDRMRILNASWWQTFSQVRLPYAVPAIISAQEITGSGSIIVAIAAEWMISSTGLGYVINNAMQNYRGDRVYAVALLATGLSFLIYTFVHWLGGRLDWRTGDPRR